MQNLIKHAARLLVSGAIFLTMSTPQPAQANAATTLWYEQPANNAMNEALPIGNGRLGGVLFGGVERERLQFNEDSLWTGGENPSGNYDSMGEYQTFGDLFLSFNPGSPPAILVPSGDKATVTNEEAGYRRALDISTGVASTQFTRDGVRHAREAFASHPAQVLVLRWSADKPGTISGAIQLKGAHGESTLADGNTLSFAGKLNNGLQYEAAARVLAKGGTATANNGKIQLRNCDEVVVLLSGATDYALDYTKGYRTGVAPHAGVLARLDVASRKSYDALRAESVKDFQTIFNRVALDLGKSSTAQTALPTDKRKVEAAKTVDPELEALLFQYGRYLLISCSRPGALPANLQGLWNDSNSPAWHSDYHSNINVQMNYWPAEVANMAEMHTPFFDLIASQLPAWRKATALSPDYKTNTGAMTTRGFAIRTSHSTMGGMGWKWDKTANAWYCQHLWEHYAFGQDKEYLRSVAYPIIKETTEFWDDHLKALPDGRLVIPNGWSPEHGPTEDGVSYNQQIVWDLFNNFVEASNALGVDKEYSARVAGMRDRLVQPKIGKWGQLQEWMDDKDDPNDHHRHTSHLFGVFPGRQIGITKTPELAAAAKKSLDARGIDAGSDVREWSLAWRTSLYARLHEAEKAHKMVQWMFDNRNTCANLLGLHPPMQIDGNWGMTAGIAEMLLQSHEGEINLLPALPSAWRSGSISGLRARGGFEVNIAWQDRKLTTATIRSVGGTAVRVRHGEKVVDFKMPAGSTKQLGPTLAPFESRQLLTAGETPRQWGDRTTWGDQGDGTYNNPILPADFSDLDCIRVGSDYYAISSTMQFSPGMVILHSKDLVNWTILGHAVSDVTQIGPEMNWDKMNRYGRGVWAGSIRYHDDKFWVYFGTPDEGYFMTTASNPAGPWAPLTRFMAESGWDDCCPFWDDDGQGYFIGTKFKDNYKTYIFKMTPDGRAPIREAALLVNEGNHREANKLFKKDGWYYHFFSEVKGARVVMMQRAKSIRGPYEEKKQLTDQNRDAREPNQGGLVDTPDGDWFFFTHHGTGDWEGRAASLLPVKWVDGWPLIGESAANGLGQMAWTGKKPLTGTKIKVPQTDDDFTTAQLGPQWEWNHQPRADKWSLTEEPGVLRLKAFKPLRPDDLLKAGNTLTQRCLRTSANEVVVKLALSGMADGQKAGLCHFAAPHHAALGAAQDGTKRTLEFKIKGKITEGPVLAGNDLWLRSVWGLDGRSQFSYSPDGRTFTDFGEPYQLQWGSYRGDRIGIYSFNNKAEAGYVDCDSFTYRYDSPANRTATPPPAANGVTNEKTNFGRALIPDMVADPSIVEIDGTFYCYATTDGWGRALETSGTPVVWKSQDFLNWSFQGSSFPPDFDAKYWAPSTVVRRNGRFYSYPTLDGKVTAVVAGSPKGPFTAADGTHITRQNGLSPFPIEQKSSIDAEVFVDDDEQAYMVWSRRRIVKLKPDLLTPDGAHVEVPTKRGGYSEGPFLFKRKGIYYYLYTLGGDEAYQYAYMMSRTSPLGPWEAPEQDIIATTDREEGVFGPGHGCFFSPQDSEQWYFVYLEYGRSSTNRQIFADKMDFNADGTIRPIKLTKAGVGALRPMANQATNLALGCTAVASSTRADARVPPRKEPTLNRIESFAVQLAVDNSNGSRWMAAEGDNNAWWQLDLGAPRDISRTEAYFVKPAAGHAYKLEHSLDGQTWSPYGGHENVILQSPHTDAKVVRARYLKLTFLSGEPGLWEFRVY